jgi:hypothetical protein
LLTGGSFMSDLSIILFMFSFEMSRQSSTG